jgi:hypothetical protein
MSKTGYKGISRIDQEKKKTYGWFVRISCNGTKKSKFFSDQSYGNKEAALQEAIKYRDQMEKELGKPRTDRTVVTQSPRNRTGIIGVQRKSKTVKGTNGEKVSKEYFEVSWSPWPGRLCRTWISIDKYGEKGALLKACALRREKEREMYGGVVRPNWVSALGKLG